MTRSSKTEKANHFHAARRSEAFWKAFERTGSVGAYLLYAEEQAKRRLSERQRAKRR